VPDLFVGGVEGAHRERDARLAPGSLIDSCCVLVWR
jgi:hypothetical protein